MGVHFFGSPYNCEQDYCLLVVVYALPMKRGWLCIAVAVVYDIQLFTGFVVIHLREYRTVLFVAAVRFLSRVLALSQLRVIYFFESPCMWAAESDWQMLCCLVVDARPHLRGQGPRPPPSLPLQKRALHAPSRTFTFNSRSWKNCVTMSFLSFLFR